MPGSCAFGGVGDPPPVDDAATGTTGTPGRACGPGTACGVPAGWAAWAAGAGDASIPAPTCCIRSWSAPLASSGIRGSAAAATIRAWSAPSRSPAARAAAARPSATSMSCRAMVASARSAQNVLVTGHRTSPGLADRAPAIAVPLSRNATEATIPTAARKELLRAGADSPAARAARWIAFADGGGGSSGETVRARQSARNDSTVGAERSGRDDARSSGRRPGCWCASRVSSASSWTSRYTSTRCTSTRCTSTRCTSTRSPDGPGVRRRVIRPPRPSLRRRHFLRRRP